MGKRMLLLAIVLQSLVACSSMPGLPEHPWGKTNAFVVVEKLQLLGITGGGEITGFEASLAMNPRQNLFNFWYQHTLYDFTLAVQENDSQVQVSNYLGGRNRAVGMAAFTSCLNKYLEWDKQAKEMKVSTDKRIATLPLLIGYKYRDSSKPVYCVISVDFSMFPRENASHLLRMSFEETKGESVAGIGYLPGIKMFPWFIDEDNAARILNDLSQQSIETKAKEAAAIEDRQSTRKDDQEQQKKKQESINSLFN